MITLHLHVHYEIHDEVSKNDKVHNSFIKFEIERLNLNKQEVMYFYLII